jgi:hypothetical protein
MFEKIVSKASPMTGSAEVPIRKYLGNLRQTIPMG